MPTLEQAHAALEAGLAESEDEEAALRLQVTDLNAAIADANTRIAQLTASRDADVAESATLGSQIVELDAEQDLLQQRLAEVEAQIAAIANMQVPPSSGTSLVKGKQGIAVWALQRALNAQGYGLLEDGLFGDSTDWAVREFQRKNNLTVDGIFGRGSSAVLAVKLAAKPTDVPKGLIRGAVEHESGNWIAAVNWTVAGGVDCGYLQRRVYDADLNNQAVIRRAFDGEYQVGLLANQLEDRHNAFFGRPGAQTHERAWRLAMLNHNYPFAATEYSFGRWPSSYALSPQDWVLAVGAKFPDGAPIKTPHEWCQHYSLGAPGHNDPGQTTKYAYPL